MASAFINVIINIIRLSHLDKVFRKSKLITKIILNVRVDSYSIVSIRRARIVGIDFDSYSRGI